MKYIKFFNQIRNQDVALVGGKNASLGEMYQKLVPLGIQVPNGLPSPLRRIFTCLKREIFKIK